MQNNATKSIVSNSEFILLLDQGNMDKEDVRDIFDMSENQINCVSDVTPGTGLIRFGNKIVPFDNRMQKDCGLYKLFNTNFHEKWGAIG